MQEQQVAALYKGLPPKFFWREWLLKHDCPYAQEWAGVAKLNATVREMLADTLSCIADSDTENFPAEFDENDKKLVEAIATSVREPQKWFFYKKLWKQFFGTDLANNQIALKRLKKITRVVNQLYCKNFSKQEFGDFDTLFNGFFSEEEAELSQAVRLIWDSKKSL